MTILIILAIIIVGSIAAGFVLEVLFATLSFLVMMPLMIYALFKNRKELK